MSYHYTFEDLKWDNNDIKTHMYTPLKISNGTNTTVYLSKLDETKSMYILDCLTNKL